MITFTYLFTIYCLFRGLQQFINHLFRFESNEAESFPLIFSFIERHLHFNNLNNFEVFNVLIRMLVRGYLNICKLCRNNKILTVPNCEKKFLISSSESSVESPPTNIFPCLAFAFLGSTFLLFITWSPAFMIWKIVSLSN